MTETAAIALKDVAKSFAEGDRPHVVFQTLSAEFRHHELTAVLGRSGCGKSTILNLISGLERPDRGEVFLLGHPLTQMNDRARSLLRRVNVGFVFQFFNLIPTLTVAENLHLTLRLAGVRRREAGQRIHELLAKVGLADRAAGFPDRLSGGEQQRIAIIRALAHRPAIVLADEPTGNLDDDTAKDVLDLFVSMVRDEGTTVVLVTHAANAARFADRVVFLRGDELTDSAPTP